MLSILNDGERHTKEELHACLEDDFAPLTAIKYHIVNLRVILRARSRGIVLERIDGVVYYRQVQYLSVTE
jgi:hypothetical protein